MKTVPKYVTAVFVKDFMEEHLPAVDHNDKTAVLLRSAVKSVTAGAAGAGLTNPLDVLRNEYVILFCVIYIFIPTLYSYRLILYPPVLFIGCSRPIFPFLRASRS
jgi:hypothetical protein